MKTEILIWSRIGHTPITGRKGAYCDELIRSEVDCADPSEARAFVHELIHSLQHADYGHFLMRDWPNQNTRGGFVS